MSSFSNLNICGLCHKVIYEHYTSVVGNKKLHSACLKCSRCAISLSSGERCYEKNEELFCDGCYFRLFALVQCKGCSQGIWKSEYVMKTQDNFYHVYCFRCQLCKVMLQSGERYGVKGDELYCELHYYDNNAVGFQQGNPPPDYFVDRNVEHDSVTLEVFHSITPSMPSFSPLPCLSDDETQKKKFQHRLMKEKRYRTTFTPEQIEMMQNAFKNEKNPDSTSLQKLSKEINLSKRVLQVWFQNARAKYKKSTFQSERADKLESSESSEDHNTHQINCFKESSHSALLSSEVFSNPNYSAVKENSDEEFSTILGQQESNQYV